MRFVLVLILAWLSVCQATNSLTVIKPIQLAKLQGKPELTITDFSSRRGSLDIFRYLILAQPFDACSPLAISTQNLNLNDDYFVLANGKNCSHKKKTHMAREIGAIGIIIINDDKSMGEEPYYGQKDTRMLSFLIDSNEGQIIRDYMVNDQAGSIYVEVSYQSALVADKSNLQIWVSAIDHNSYQALHMLRETLQKFPEIDQKLDWTPRYVLYGCNRNTSGGDNNACRNTVATKLSCACGGELCSPSEVSTTSNIIVMEDIRQKYIFKSNPQKYFDYVKGIQKMCLAKYIEQKNIDGCSQKVANIIGLNLTLINERVQESAQYCNNSMYKDLLLDKSAYARIAQYPSITLNREIIRYQSKQDFQRTLCKKLGLDKEQNCAGILVNMVDESSLPWYVYFFLVVGISFAGILVLLWFKRQFNKDISKEMRMQVDTAIEHYYTFNETQLK